MPCLQELGAGYAIKIRNHSHLLPYAITDYFFVRQDSFNETGAQSLNLGVRRNDAQLMRSELGLGFEIPFSQGKFTAKLGGAYWKMLSGSRFTANLEGLLDTFTVIYPADPLFEIAPGIGLSYFITDKLTATAAYMGEFNSEFQIHDAKALINWCF